MNYELNETLVNAILDFLSRQPYVNVWQLIEEIRHQCNERKLHIVKENTEEKKED